jgi:hypothetical protein
METAGHGWAQEELYRWVLEYKTMLKYQAKDSRLISKPKVRRYSEMGVGQGVPNVNRNR